MSTIIPVELDSEGLIDDAADGTTIFTVPASYNARIYASVVNLSTTTADWFECYYLPDGETISTISSGYLLIPRTNLGPGATYLCPELNNKIFGPASMCAFLSSAGLYLNVYGSAVKILKPGS